MDNSVLIAVGVARYRGLSGNGKNTPKKVKYRKQTKKRMWEANIPWCIKA